VRYNLRPLTLPEVREYINFRLKRAGSRNLILFDKTAVKAIYKYSRGIPRLINILCDNALLTGFSEDKNRIDKTLIQKTIRDVDGTFPSSGLASKRLRYIVAAVALVAAVSAGTWIFSEPIVNIWRKFYG